MGRTTITAINIYQPLRLELSSLLKNKVLVKGKTTSSIIEWKKGASIKLIARWKEEEQALYLSYSSNHKTEHQRQPFNYKIELTSVPSNLGKGEILYFVCPDTGRNCRKIYLCPNTMIFKSREAHPKRLYYKCQRKSKYDRWLTRYFDTQKELEALEQQPYRKTYNNKPTRKALQIEQLKERLALYELRKENLFEWRCYHWGINFFGLPIEEQNSILNTDEFLYYKYHEQGKRSII